MKTESETKRQIQNNRGDRSGQCGQEASIRLGVSHESKYGENLIIRTFDVMEEFNNIPVLIVDLVSESWRVNDRQLHPHPLFVNVCAAHTDIKHTHFSGNMSPVQP